ncbi:MAG: hypothetical protein L0322_25140 [Chloroflexi bacterium]|nr:hypothetical protein [Chloroflexota bacterium]MCI0578693.1 hypothetical protein [Chloroflexota bacterium]MCI0648353.1 hypothetical protein [Chloroflexota bacterium]
MKPLSQLRPNIVYGVIAQAPLYRRQRPDGAAGHEIDQNGFIRDRDYARLTERAKATRSLDFKKLIELGLIVRWGAAGVCITKVRARQPDNLLDTGGFYHYRFRTI